MNHLEVFIGKTMIHNGIILPYDKSTAKPQIIFDHDPKKYYSSLMVDPDAPAKYWLHLLIINNDQVLAEYQPPEPPVGDGLHRYMFYIFEQPKFLDENNIKNYIGKKVLTNRGNFNFGDFIAQFQLKELGHIYFRTERK